MDMREPSANKREPGWQFPCHVWRQAQLAGAGGYAPPVCGSAPALGFERPSRLTRSPPLSKRWATPQCHDRRIVVKAWASPRGYGPDPFALGSVSLEQLRPNCYDSASQQTDPAFLLADQAAQFCVAGLPNRIALEMP